MAKSDGSARSRDGSANRFAAAVFHHVPVRDDLDQYNVPAGKHLGQLDLLVFYWARRVDRKTRRIAATALIRVPR
jgi:hypothetical protein